MSPVRQGTGPVVTRVMGQATRDWVRWAMHTDPLETGRVFRIAGWVWLGYLAALALVDLVIYANRDWQPAAWYHLANAVPAGLFLGLAHSRWLTARARGMIPALIGVIAVTPVLLHYVLDLHLPAAPLSNLEGMVLRQLPVLFLGLVLVAWHYSFPWLLFFSVSTAGLEYVAAASLRPLALEQQAAFTFVLAIRVISLTVVGLFTNQLIRRLREQQAALRLANLQLAQHASTLETLAVSRERNRLARELHDTLAHTLSGLAVQLETTKAYWEEQPATANTLLVNALTTTRLGLDETRRALKALRASPLEDLGLRLALQQLADAAAERGRLTLVLDLPAEIPALTLEAEQGVYRIAQEALENVVRHAGARSLTVRLSAPASGVTLLIEDDGHGFVAAADTSSSGHYGMAGMRERAELAGGALSVVSQPGHGTRVELKLKGANA